MTWISKSGKPHGNKGRKGQVAWNKGKSMSDEHKAKLSKSHLGISTWNKGKSWSDEVKLKMSLAKKGMHKSPATEFKKGQFAKEKHYFWKGGVTPEYKIIRHSKDMQNWRKAVFEKDNYTCQGCESKGIYIEPHHLLSFSDNPEYRFEVWNGQTLCRDCHVHLHNELGWK